MFKSLFQLSIAFTAFLTVCESNGLIIKKNDRIGYGGEPMSAYEDRGYEKSIKPKIQIKKSYELGSTYEKGDGKQYHVKVISEDSPVKVKFHTPHTPVHIQQVLHTGQPEFQKVTTHEKPHVFVHEVIKPVIQEYREIIVPYRKVIQKIEPLKDERTTVVANKDREEGGDDDSDKKYNDRDSDKGGDRGDDGYKPYRDEDNKKYEKNLSLFQYYHQRGGHNYRDDDKDRDYGSKISNSKRVLSSLMAHQELQYADSDNSQLSTLANGGTMDMNNGPSLATIFGTNGWSSEELAKFS